MAGAGSTTPPQSVTPPLGGKRGGGAGATGVTPAAKRPLAKGEPLPSQPGDLTISELSAQVKNLLAVQQSHTPWLDSMANALSDHAMRLDVIRDAMMMVNTITQDLTAKHQMMSSRIDATQEIIETNDAHTKVDNELNDKEMNGVVEHVNEKLIERDQSVRKELDQYDKSLSDRLQRIEAKVTGDIMGTRHKLDELANSIGQYRVMNDSRATQLGTQVQETIQYMQDMKGVQGEKENESGTYGGLFADAQHQARAQSGFGSHSTPM